MAGISSSKTDGSQWMEKVLQQMLTEHSSGKNRWHAPIIMQCAPKDTLNLDEAAPCDMQPKRSLPLKRQTEMPWKEGVTILCSDADGSEKPSSNNC